MRYKIIDTISIAGWITTEKKYDLTYTSNTQS
jgi:hypothetical protein